MRATALYFQARCLNEGGRKAEALKVYAQLYHAEENSAYLNKAVIALAEADMAAQDYEAARARLRRFNWSSFGKDESASYEKIRAALQEKGFNADAPPRDTKLEPAIEMEAVKLPEVARLTPEEEARQITVRVAANGAITFQGKEVTDEEFKQQARQLAKADAGRRVLIRSHSSAAAKRISAIMMLVSDAGFKKIAFSVLNPGRPGEAKPASDKLEEPGQGAEADPEHLVKSQATLAGAREIIARAGAGTAGRKEELERAFGLLNDAMRPALIYDKDHSNSVSNRGLLGELYFEMAQTLVALEDAAPGKNKVLPGMAWSSFEGEER